RVTAVKGRCLNRLTMEPRYIAFPGCFKHHLFYHTATADASFFCNAAAKPEESACGFFPE
ncbi:MAG: hypothetical protein NC123_15175, partial [Butyrivibrio sp.]|nr:hypothetical protein [Acetatifactor muris]MCM1560862.1 hypothetical protein [Butyrivibrio sp.]